MRASDIDPVISISRQNESFHNFIHLGDRLEVVDLFNSSSDAVRLLWRMRSLRNQFMRRIEEDQIDTVVSLMPHFLDPLIAPRSALPESSSSPSYTTQRRIRATGPVVWRASSSPILSIQTWS